MNFTKTTTQHPFFDFMDPIMNNTWELPKFSPSSKVHETESGYSINILAPGISEEDISVEFDSIKNELYVEYTGEGNDFISNFKKVYDVPHTINTESIEVYVDLGILNITMLRKEEVSRKKIF
tara:strand:+ start:1979 stop:2347 length:369 start_codon:yes stop_codon:yes gene_type:complete